MKITLRDVDGTITGRAALVSINLNGPDGEMNNLQYSPFIEGEHRCTDPCRDARALWESIKGDLPGHSMAVIANPRAKYLDWVRRCKGLGLADSDLTPECYLSPPQEDEDLDD